LFLKFKIKFYLKKKIIDYKDEIPYGSDENMHESSNEKMSTLDVSGFTDYSQIVSKPINLSILLNYILSSQNENPKNFVSFHFYRLNKIYLI
jgi:hypothetical protein